MPDAPTPVDPEADKAPAPDAPEAAPWGDDFDKDRAWKTITTQRAEAKALRAELAEFQAAKKAAEDASKTEAEKLAERTTAAESDLAASRREVWALRAAVKHALPDDLADFLTGDTEEAVMKQAERLAGFTTKGDDKPTPADGLPTKPVPDLKPGDKGIDDTGPFDPLAAAEAARKAAIY